MTCVVKKMALDTVFKNRFRAGGRRHSMRGYDA